MSAFILQTVRVQPNDGFGTILPHEKIDLYLYFSPEKAEVIYNCFLPFCIISFCIYENKYKRLLGNR